MEKITPTPVDVLVKLAEQKDITEQELAILNEYRRRSPEHEDVVKKFNDPQWVQSQLQTNLTPSPGKEIKAYVRSHLTFTPEPWHAKIWRWLTSWAW